jgi:hypothetical protein
MMPRTENVRLLALVSDLLSILFLSPLSHPPTMPMLSLIVAHTNVSRCVPSVILSVPSLPITQSGIVDSIQYL